MATQYMRDMLLFLVLAVKSDPFHILQSYTLLEDNIESYGHKEKRSISQSLDLLSGVGMHVARVRELSSYIVAC